MDKIQILDRHYLSFINLDSPRDFFMGMADYLDFIDSVPEFKVIADKIDAQKKVLDDRAVILGQIVINELNVVKDELQEYISKNKIENAGIQQELKEYAGWQNGTVVGSSTIPDALHQNLTEVILVLFKMPEHRNFLDKYIEYYGKNKELPNKFIQIPEYIEYSDIIEEIKEGAENTLWGLLTYLATLYGVIKEGKKKIKYLLGVNKENRTTITTWEMFNCSILVGEWHHIDDKSQNDLLFFNVKKVRTLVTRLHNYFLAQSVLQPIQSQPLFEKFEARRGLLYFAGKEISISKTGKETFQTQLLATLLKENRYWFTDEVLTDWGYSDEEAEKIPKTRPYQAALRISEMVAKEAQITDFIEYSTEKFRINPKYIKSL